MSTPVVPSGAIAVIGMTGRFPGARSIEEFWRNLCEGRESISFFTDEELAEAGVDAPRNEPRYVKARGVVENAEWFDAAFFGLSPREAEVIDPQQRMFLECSAEALERAGYDTRRYEGLVGVFAGASINTYVVHNLYSHASYREKASTHQIGLANEKDYMPARVSYKLNLRGPSLNIQSACATSLTTVCLACQSLLQHQCDIALAGGATLTFPQKHGYWHQEGGIFSPDGHCRPFDASARGTVLGDGVGVVVLKRLEEAIADGDQIYAAVRGFAITNDGANKAGFAAPSVDGQAEAIGLALGMAGVEPNTIGYVEAHGTGTVIGDPIEVAGLTQAFGSDPSATNFCAIGSVKSNVGHLDGAAGIAGFVKAVLAVHHGLIPPSLHYRAPNPQIDFAHSPFYVNDRLKAWAGNGTPRRAGVSSLGIGGTNTHVVLEEVQAAAASGPSRTEQIVVVSAKTESALDQATANLAGHLAANPATNLADVAYTLQVGRMEMPYRRFAVARDAAGAATAFREAAACRVRTGAVQGVEPSIAFLFPGQGAQTVNMGRELYAQEPVFRQQVDACAELLKAQLGIDIRTVLFPEAGAVEAAAASLGQTRLTQPALFTIEYSLANLWMSWGVRPAAMLGHSIGEYVAACLAGVFPLEAALSLVVQRAQLMQQQSPGAMLAVRMREDEALALLGADISLAAVNGVASCVVSGPSAAVAKLEQELQRRGVGCRALRTSHAFHSAMMEPVVESFTSLLQYFELSPPKIPCLSNVTGTWLTDAQATDPAYWAAQLRQTVRFADGIATLCTQQGRLFIEVGPGRTLTSMARQHPARRAETPAVATLASADENAGELDSVLEALGEVWLAGGPVDWSAFSSGERRRRVLLPTYPFERQRHWIEPAKTFRVPLEPEKERHAPTSAPAFREAPSTRHLLSDIATGANGRNHSTECHLLSDIAPASDRSKVRPPMNDAPVNAQDECHLIGDMTAGVEETTLARLVALFRELSGLDLAGRTSTTFAALGFDSLFLGQVATAVSKAFGVRIAFRDLLGSLGSLQALANHFDGGRNGHSNGSAGEPGLSIEGPADRARLPGTGEAKAGNAAPARNATQPEEPAAPARPVVTVATAPLTEPQKEIWLASQISDEASCAYNESRRLRFRGALNRAALQQAIRELVAHHEALRTTIAPEGDRQFVASTSDIVLNEFDLSDRDASASAAELKAIGAREVTQPFDLVRGPLMRASLVRIAGSAGNSEESHANGDCRSGGRADPPGPPTRNGGASGPALPGISGIGSPNQEHILFLTIHHSVCDGHSWGILLNELAARYSAATGGKSASMATATQLSDYARLQASRSASAEADDAAAWWRMQFADGVPPVDLPTDRARPAELGFAAARVSRVLAPDLRDKLRDLSARQGCTMFATLLAATSAWLGRLAGQDDLVVGIPAAERNAAGDETLVAHCVDLIPVRVRPDTGIPFAKLLSQVKEAFFDAYEHRPCSFGRILRELEVPHDAGRRPIAPVSFNFDRLAGSLEFQGLETTLEEGPLQFLNFELSVNVVETAEALHVECRFSTELFDAATVARWLGHFETLLRAVADDPDRTVGELPLLDGVEMHRLLAQGEGTVAAVAQGRVHGWFESQAERTPEAIALAHGNDRISYRTLNQRAGFLAGHLTQLGIGPDRLVGVCLNRTPEMIVALLAILKAGGAYVPLDPAYPSERLMLMIDDSGLDLILTVSALLPVLPAVGVTTLCLDTPLKRAPASCVTANTEAAGPGNLAYVLFTSGSTGRPKGVAVEHRSVSSLIEWARGIYGPDDLRGVLASTSLCFDLSVFEILVPLALGGMVILVDDVLALASRPEAPPVTLINTVPSAMAEILRLGALPESAHAINLAGEPLAQEMVEELYRQPGVRSVYDLYGPTEDTVYSTCALRRAGGHATIGRSLTNKRARVLDAQRQLVPVGVRGELYLGGAGLARGYLNQPGLTEERFVMDPFAPGERLYRTGDRVRLRPDGDIEYFGRLDHQIKVRGFRVEPGEIEAVLYRHPGVREAAVVAGQEGVQGLVAYVTLIDGTSPEELRERLLDTLPAYLVPSAIVSLPELPRTPNGKLDRRALPAPGETDLDSAADTFVAPRNPTEESLAAIWCDLLRRERIGIHDDFFSVGGNSLLAMQFMVRVRDTFQVELPLRSVFQTPTVADLARLLGDRITATT